MSKAVCTVYRTFFRYARQLQAASQILDIRQPVDKEAWQTAKHSWIVNDAGVHKSTYSPTLHLFCRGELTYIELTYMCGCGSKPERRFTSADA